MEIKTTEEAIKVFIDENSIYEELEIKLNAIKEKPENFIEIEM